MTQTWLNNTNINMADIRNCHEKIAYNFCRYYYKLMDMNLHSIRSLYINTPYITYLGNKFNNYISLLNNIKNHGISKFEHIQFTGSSQPLNDSTILINIIGTITVNNSIYWRQYNETLIIKRDIWDNWYIINNIFSLI